MRAVGSMRWDRLVGWLAVLACLGVAVGARAQPPDGGAAVGGGVEAGAGTENETEPETETETEPETETETETASAPGVDVLVWDPRWERPGWPHVLASALSVGVGLLSFFLDLPDRPRWSERNGFDDAAHDDLALDSRHDRELAALVSDVMLDVLIAFPIVIDSLLVAGLIHQSEDVALQTALVSGEVLTYAFLAQALTRHAARERPFVPECASDPDYAEGCGGDGNARNASFVSGHALMAFASAGVVCVNHIHLRLYGSPVADALGCVTATTLAGVVGVLRFNADRHWITDVIMGSSLGLLTGWLTPWLLHYAPLRDNGVSAVVVPGAPEADAGVSLSMTW